MSTKAIREALKVMRESFQEATNSTTVPGEVVAAMAEVEAIEKAAEDWVAVDGQPGPGKMQRLDALLRSIAQETA